MGGVERNIECVRRLEDAFNQRSYALLGELISDGFAGHNPGSKTVTVEGLRDNNEDWHAAMPGKRTEVVFAFGSGDQVVARIRDRGTNTGGLPWFDIPANGKAMDIDWIQITRHEEDGRIAEMWALADVPRLLAQLGSGFTSGD
jgi:predicted ester cyclase